MMPNTTSSTVAWMPSQDSMHATPHHRSSKEVYTNGYQAPMYDRNAAFGSYSHHMNGQGGRCNGQQHNMMEYGSRYGASHSGRGGAAMHYQQQQQQQNCSSRSQHYPANASRNTHPSHFHYGSQSGYSGSRPSSRESMEMPGYRPNSAGTYMNSGYGQPQTHSDFHRMSYPHSHYQNTMYSHSRNNMGGFHGHDMQRSSSNTPSSQLAAMNFTESQDDSSRSSSPAGIPPPPQLRPAPMSAPAKIRVPIATRPIADDSLGPLRESSQRLNVLHETVVEEREEDDNRKPSGSEERDEDVVEKGEEANVAPKPAKPTPSIQEASLLLGLRTSNSNSPVTVPCDNDSQDCAEAMEAVGEAPSTRNDNTEITNFMPYIPKDFPRRLALPQDRAMLNSLHCYIRSNLLEVFVIEKTKIKTPNLSPSTSLGRVGLRCVHCSEARKCTGICQNEAPMAVFYPKSVSEIYRMVTSWQRCHLRKCRNLPPSVRAEWDEIRETDKSRGKTAFWVTSAKEIGLVDCPSRAGGIRFAPLKVVAQSQEKIHEV